MGPPVMSSNGNGVAGRMKHDLKKLCNFKCICHQENLALRHTYSHFSELSKFNELLYDIISYFCNSPKKVKIVENNQVEMDYDKIYSFIKPKEIRWNSFYYATNRVRKLYPALLKTIKQIESNAILKEELKDAQEIYNKLTDFNFIYILNWLSDFLMPICDLNKTLQSNTFELIKLKESIKTTLRILKFDYIEFTRENLNNLNNYDTMNQIDDDKAIKNHLKFGGFFLSLFLSKCKFINNILEYICLEEDQNEFKVSLNYDKLRCFEAKFFVQKASKYLYEELNNIVPGSDSFYSNFQIFSFENFHSKTEAEINQYGNKEILDLYKFYLPDMINEYNEPEDIIIFKWIQVKVKLLKDWKAYIIKTDFINYILNDTFFDSGFEAIKRLIKIYLIMPISNAEVERGFSCLKRIKTLQRNRLLSESISSLMMISLNGVDILE